MGHITRPDGTIRTYTVEELFDIDKEDNDERVIKVVDLKHSLNKVDTAFRLATIDRELNPQTLEAIKEAWELVRNIQLGD